MLVVTFHCYLILGRQFVFLTTDGADVAAIAILDKEHYNYAIRGHFSQNTLHIHDFNFFITLV